MHLNVSYRGNFSSLEEIDPTKISYSSFYYLLEQVTSPLIEFNSRGELVSGLAKTFTWEGNILVLRLREDYRTIDGHEVTADDVIFSLKRAFQSKKNSFGQDSAAFCGDDGSDLCTNISAPDKHTVKIRAEHGRDHLVKLLAVINYGILRQDQVSAENKVIDFRNSTGPYSLSSIESDGTIHLAANPSHWHYSSKMPQTVTFLPTAIDSATGVRASSFTEFEQGRADFIPSFAAQETDKFVALGTRDDARLREVTGLMGILLVFTERGKQELTAEQRFSVGRKVKQSLQSRLLGKVPGSEPCDQFFGELRKEGLSEDQAKELNQRFEQAPESWGTKVKISTFPGGLGNTYLPPLQGIEGLEVASDFLEFDFRQESDFEEGFPHAYIVMTSLIWRETVSHLTYTMERKYYPFEKEQALSHLRDFVRTESGAERQNKLRNFQYASLAEPIVVPIFNIANYTIVRSNWLHDDDPNSNTGMLWRMRLAK